MSWVQFFEVVSIIIIYLLPFYNTHEYYQQQNRSFRRNEPRIPSYLASQDGLEDQTFLQKGKALQEIQDD